ncbi:VRR-NUC domain-containing protein [Fodinicurvata sp. EGI_FJ10296]|uniref:VRR-NUC domain-containing protein n=1 Tax=Fodinicurvata sp. EGI_FJ10296 TaxID=3231908 RepID=UPI003456AB1B
MRAGDALIRNARPLHAGLCVGSPDLVGWRAVTITPEMVGAQIAQFTGIEVKTGRQRPTRAQRQFLDTLQRFGGFALVVREGDDLAAVLDGTGPLS